MKVFFLYTELAEYFLKCCEALSQEAEVHIARWPVNNEAPFKFSVEGNITLYDKKSLSRTQLVEFVQRVAPDIIVCSGWIDKDYMHVCRKYFGRIPTVMTLDTHWKGSLRQHLATLVGRFVLGRTFSHAWVPGDIQARYARKLGFRKRVIHKGFYCCDLPRFNAIYEKRRTAEELPHRFIYTGRYYDFKGVTDLWEAFAEFKKEHKNDWELWCVGTGSIPPAKHPAIRHFGFLQPSELPPVLAEAGVFVLPSRFEPWGVVVQEFAAAGFPLLLSDRTGAREQFLQEGMNGFGFKAEDRASLKEALKKITEIPAKALTLMAGESHTLAQAITHDQWVSTLRSICGGHYENKNINHRGGR